MIPIGSNSSIQSKLPSAPDDSISEPQDCVGNCAEQKSGKTTDRDPTRSREPTPSTKRKSHSDRSAQTDQAVDQPPVLDQPGIEFANLLNDMNPESATEIPEIGADPIAAPESDFPGSVIPDDWMARRIFSSIDFSTLQIAPQKTIESDAQLLVLTQVPTTIAEATQLWLASWSAHSESKIVESQLGLISMETTASGDQPTFELPPFPGNLELGIQNQPSVPESLITTSVGEEKVQSSIWKQSTVADSVVRQVMETIVTESVNLSGNSSRSLSIQIHPAELGRLEIVIGSNDDMLKAQIVASETVTSELLTREKSHLITALREQGIDLTDVDISHRDPRDQDPQQFQASYPAFAEQDSKNRAVNLTTDLSSAHHQRRHSTALIDVIV